MKFLALLFTPVFIGIAFYFYFYLKRAMQTFGLPMKERKWRLIAGAAVLAVGVLCYFTARISLVILLHVFLIDLLLRLIALLVKLIFCKRKEAVCRVVCKIRDSGILPLALGVFIVLGGYLNLCTVVATRYTVETDKNIRAEGYRVVMLADVHYGVSLDYEELLEKCDEINAQQPDLILLGGDLIDGSTTQAQILELYRALGTLEARYGVYYVHGNHDRPFSMDSYTFTTKDLETAITAAGIRILDDEVVQITDDLVLIGREDRSADRMDHGDRAELSELMAKADADDYVIVLDHQPCEYAENERLGTDLLLSGHTHGGQIVPLNWLQEVIPFNDGVYGRYPIGNGEAIITAGFGTWNFPVKTGVPAEYLVIDIVPGK